MSTQVLSVRFPCGRVEIEYGGEVHVPNALSVELARHLPKCKDLAVLDLGCGAGLFAVVAARSGAREAWATDVCGEAVDFARKNAERNKARVEVGQGDWFEPVGLRRFDLIVTNPPQTPAPLEARHPKFAGADGLLYMERILRDAPDHLAPKGRLLTMLISLADTNRFLSLASGRFDVQGLGQVRRDFTRAEYEGYAPGLHDYFLSRKCEMEDGWFWVRYYCLTLR